MDANQKNIAVARGEALAASLLAAAAIRTVMALTTANREEVLAGIYAYVDDTLNMSGPGKGDPNDEFSTQVRETARFQAMQTLDEIERLFRQAKGV